MTDKPESEKEKSPEQEKLLEAGDGVAIKFLPAAADTCTNGDAKIELGEAGGIASACLRKEDLLKFANDPFWVRLRWLLFLLFWAAWLAMLAGAIFIIVVAPKCPAPEPRLWWEKGQLVTVDAAEENGLNGLVDKLATLHRASAGLIVQNVLKSDADGVIDYKDVNPNSGSVDDFKRLASKAKDLGMRVIMELEINHCSAQHEWFIKSLNKTGEYADFFVWKDAGTERTADGKPKPPNNWISVTEGPAWEFDKTRQQFYLHQFGVKQPDLNLRNADVQMEIRKVLQFWRGKGVSGFLFKDASYLTEDASFEDELASGKPSDAVFSDYQFYSHVRTKNLPENVEILSVFKSELLSELDEPEDKVVFAADVSGSASDVVQYYGQDRPPVVELPLNRVAKAESAVGLEQLMGQWKKAAPADVWPNWVLASNPDPATPEAQQTGLALTLALLPGTFIYQPGAELQTWNASSKNDVFSVMLGARSEREVPSVMYGDWETGVFGSNVFGYTRKKSGNPGYLVLLNLGSEAQKVNVTGFSDVPETLSLVLRSGDPPDNSLPLKSKVDADSVPVPEGAAVVLTFVPQKH